MLDFIKNLIQERLTILEKTKCFNNNFLDLFLEKYIT